MKKIILILFILSSSLFTFSQTWLWGKQGLDAVGISYYSTGNVVAVSEDKNNNVFGAGNLADTVTFDSYKLINPYNYDVFLVKYDLNGNLLWAKQANLITASTSASIFNVAADVYGNAYIIGFFRGTMSFGKDTLVSRNRGQNFFLVKYNASGNEIWAKEVRQDTNGYAIGLATDKKGYIYVTGNFQDSIVFGVYTLKATRGTGATSVFLAKYDSGGHVIWARQSQKLNSYVNKAGGTSISVYDTSVYVAGYFSDTCIFEKDTLLSKYAFGDVFLVKYDTGGGINWVRQSNIKSKQAYAGVQNAFCGVTADASGNVYITSSFADTVVFGAYKFTSVIGINGGYITPFLVKYAANGNILWAQASTLLPNYNNWYGSSLTTDAYRHVYWGGSLSGPAGYSSQIVFGPDTLTEPPSGSGDADFFIELDSLGHVLCTSIIPPSTSSQQVSILASDPTGNDIYLGSALVQNYVFGKDTLIETGNIYHSSISYPFIAKWKSCITNYMELSARADSVCSNNCNGVATAFPIGGSPPYTYLWSNGATTQQDSNLCPGTYIAVVSDTTGKKDTIRVSIVSAPLNLQLSPALDSVCKGDSVLLKASGATNYQWSTGSTNNTIWVKPDSSARYILHGFSGSCSDSAVAAIHVISLNTSVSASNDTICHSGVSTLAINGADGPSTYQWSTGATTSSIQVTDTATTTYTVSIHGPCGDSAKKAITVTVLPLPKTSISGTLLKCMGTRDTILASGGGNYLWGNGSTGASYYTGPIHADSTIYVTITGANGCSVRDSFTVKPYPVIQPVITGSTMKCTGSYDTLVVSGGLAYQWANGNTNAIYYTGTINTDSTIYVTVKDSNNCFVRDSFFIRSYNPLVNACCNTTIISGDDTVLVAKGKNIIKYRWFDSSGVVCLNPPLCDSVEVHPAVTTTYTVTGTDASGCSAESIVTIVVEIPCSTPSIPNVFTPSYPGLLGVDNVFYVKTGSLSSWSIIIYDRWGKEMYNSTNPNEYWNGNAPNGGQAPAGVYYYIIDAVCQATTFKQDGFVQLIR